jgi:hypothetical protein
MLTLMKQATRLSVILGAGFSKWAAGLPVAAELFDFAIEPFGVSDDRKIEFVRLAKQTWDQDHAEGVVEQFIAHALAGTHDMRTAVSWYIVRRFSEPYIWKEWHAGKWRRHVLMIDENRKFERAGVMPARDFLYRMRPFLCGIITTNYDLLVEYALGTRLFNYGQPGEVLTGRGAYPVSQWRNPVTLQGSIALAKMHGSISWDLEGRYTDGRRGITGNALIVAPTPEKTAPVSLAFEWELAGRILRESTRLLVFGFAFNPYDEALLNHLKEYGSNIEHVIVVDKSPRPDRVTAIWPQAHLYLFPPPPEEGPEREDWFANLDRALIGPSNDALQSTA